MIKLIKQLVDYIVWAYNQTHWFTDKEAWWIYRLGAILETIGWILLISAIIYRRFNLPYDDAFVSVAGRTHGIFFVAYFGAVIATARSMGWGIWRFAAALIAGMPPFTSIIFEQAMSIQRKRQPVYVAPPANIHDD